MLGAVLHYLANFFEQEVRPGSYTIQNGSLALPFVLAGQYFRIVGSVRNDGVYRYPAKGLQDEKFEGAVWALAVPPEVAALAAEIAAWQTKHPDSPYTSESFGGYSYTKAAGADGAPVSWTQVFAARLAPYKKLRVNPLVRPTPRGTPRLPRNDNRWR